MRAILCRTLGEPSLLTLEELPPPVLGPGQVRIVTHAAGVNFADSLVVAGKYQEKPPLPFIPGFEIAGVVSGIGDGVAGIAPGDRVMALTGSGGFAEEAVVGADAVFRIPDSMSFEAAAGFPIAYGTSHGALDWRAHLQPGEILLIHGAAGGVGLTAVEIGKAMGATVIATASSAAKLEIARSRGADHLIDYSTEDVQAQVKALLGERRVDVAYDPVGGSAFEASLRTIAWEGRILIIGFAGGTVPQIPANILLVKNCSVIGFYWSSYRTRNPALLRGSFETLLGWVAEGKLRPLVSETLPLDRAGEAIGRLKARQATGKLVLTMGR
ncbi:MAG: NADPH:quinone oxidoreductase family protein [Aliidongia sp.]